MNALAPIIATDLGETLLASPELQHVFGRKAPSNVQVRRLLGMDTIVISKFTAGFDEQAVEACSAVLKECSRGGRLKLVVFDFAHVREAEAEAADGFDELVSQVANLILRAPVVSIALARGPMRASDLELALACNVLLGEQSATFHFDIDPLASVRTYAFLAQKIGFVRAERLMENGQQLNATDMQGLMLLKEVLTPGSAASSLPEVMGKYLRRHNFFYGMHRAQRIATPYVHAFAGPLQAS